ncbi:MAG TPA: hypothetical protein PKM63_01600 [Panacibacter sp.]|nr:hypothetical protein [Panacibacter sp.]HNP42949.1 hypothetical protein [Panacibacter sp.]
MNKVVKTALLTIGANIASLLLIFIPVLIMLVLLSLIGQLIVGIVYCTKPDKKQVGQGILLGLGVFLLVGFSVCSILLMNTNFH